MYINSDLKLQTITRGELSINDLFSLWSVLRLFTRVLMLDQILWDRYWAPLGFGPLTVTVTHPFLFGLKPPTPFSYINVTAVGWWWFFAPNLNRLEQLRHPIISTISVTFFALVLGICGAVFSKLSMYSSDSPNLSMCFGCTQETVGVNGAVMHVHCTGLVFSYCDIAFFNFLFLNTRMGVRGPNRTLLGTVRKFGPDCASELPFGSISILGLNWNSESEPHPSFRDVWLHIVGTKVRLGEGSEGL